MSFGSDAIDRVRGIRPTAKEPPASDPQLTIVPSTSNDNFITNSPLNPQRKHPKWRTSSPRVPEVYISPAAEPSGGPRNDQWPVPTRSDI